MAKLLFWLTQVSLFTFGAWERTSELYFLNLRSSLLNLATKNSVWTLRVLSGFQHFLKMNTSRTFLFHLVVCFGSCSCKPLSNDVQRIEDLEKLYKLSGDLLAEEDTKSRVENLLGSIKEGFLRQLNLSAVPQERSRISPPQIMVDLYNKYVSDSSTLPQYDVIRSFMVQGTKNLTGIKWSYDLSSLIWQMLHRWLKLV